MNILITGAFGFVGTNLSAYLAEKGHELWALDVGAAIGNRRSAIGSTGRALTANDANCANGAGRGAYTKCFDWGQLEEIPWGEVDAVIHLAGKAHDTKNTSDPKSYFDINVGLTKKIVSSFVHCCESALVGDRRTEDRGQRSEVGGRCSWQDRHSETRPQSDETLSPATLPRLNQAEGRLNLVEPGRRPIEPEFPTHERMDSRTNALPKFIFFSSVKAVSDRVEGILTEDAVPNPKTPYGQSKLEAEEVVRSSLLRYCDSALVGEEALTETQRAQRDDAIGNRQSAIGNGQTTIGSDATHAPMNSRTHELLYYILRPCMIHGPGNKGNLNLLYGVVKKGIPWPLGAFENKRTFVSIENLCAVIEGLLEKNVPSGTYQMADDESLSTNELIEIMAGTLGRKARIWRFPAKLVRAAAKTGDALRLPLNSERLKKLTESYVVSNAKIKKALGWKKMTVRAGDGMRKTLESFSRQGAKK